MIYLPDKRRVENTPTTRQRLQNNHIVFNNKITK